jgi:hypothetical protein
MLSPKVHFLLATSCEQGCTLDFYVLLNGQDPAHDVG